MYKIRLAEKSDLGQVVEVLNKVTLTLHKKNIQQWRYPWNPEEIAEDIENGNMYVVVMEKNIIGSFSLRHMDTNLVIHVREPNNLYLYRIAILPEHQGKNIGNKITDYAIEISKKLGKNLYLDCWAGNVKLRAFYSKAGLTYCGDFPEEDYEISVYKYENFS